MFAERYGTCGNSGNVNSGTTYGNLWCDSNSVWRPVICVNNSSQIPSSVGFAAYRCNLPQFRPDYVNSCDSTRAQSPHSGGINICMGDGSVRFLGSGVSLASWQNACDPQDSANPGPDF
jgi:prepilin-type processing-associated H-X9-DG protein